MLCYEIVNPSDAATLLAPDREIALAALALIAEGRYAGRAIARDLEPIDEAAAKPHYVPLFLFNGPEGYEDWWRAAGWTEEPVGKALRERKAEVVAALRSCAYGRLEDRRTYQSACAAITDPAKLAAFKTEWEDRRRSSLNAIVQIAWRLADRVDAIAFPATPAAKEPA